jgi:hypothetical protein
MLFPVGRREASHTRSHPRTAQAPCPFGVLCTGKSSIAATNLGVRSHLIPLQFHCAVVMPPIGAGEFPARGSKCRWWARARMMDLEKVCSGMAAHLSALPCSYLPRSYGLRRGWTQPGPTENRSVSGSIPPLGTNRLARRDARTTRVCIMDRTTSAQPSETQV